MDGEWNDTVASTVAADVHLYHQNAWIYQKMAFYYLSNIVK